MDGGEVVSGQFVEALGEAAQVFHTAEEALNDVALAIEALVVWLWLQCVRAIRNDRHGAIVDDSLPVRGAVVTLVGTDGEWRCRVVQQLRQDRPIVNLTARQDEVERSSQPVDHGMELRRAAAA